MLSGRPVAAHPLNALDRLIRATATHQTITAMSFVTLILVVVLAISVDHLFKTRNRMNDVAVANGSKTGQPQEPRPDQNPIFEGTPEEPNDSKLTISSDVPQSPISDPQDVAVDSDSIVPTASESHDSGDPPRKTAPADTADTLAPVAQASDKLIGPTALASGGTVPE